MFSREDGEKYGERRKLTSGVYWDVHRARKVDNAVELNSYIHVLNEYKTVPLFNCLSSLVHIHPPRHADCGNLPLVLFAVTTCVLISFLSFLLPFTQHHKKI